MFVYEKDDNAQIHGQSLFQQSIQFLFKTDLNKEIKHDYVEGSNMIFHSLTFSKVPREVLKTEGKARGFQPSRGTLRMLMNDKIMFDRYHCINSTKHCENENIGTLYFITSSQFPTQVCYACIGLRSSTHNLAHALRDAW